jgi:hypothetical protein
MSTEQNELTAEFDSGDSGSPNRPEGFASRQSKLDAASPDPPAEHLTAESKNSSGNELPLTKDSEWYCEDCPRRVTVMKNRPGEAGHAVDCQHSKAVESDD